MSSTAKPPREDVFYQPLSDDEAAVLDIKSRNFYTMNATAKRVFELARDGAEVDAIVATIAEEFEVAEGECRPDVEAFLKQLVDAGLVVST